MCATGFHRNSTRSTRRIQTAELSIDDLGLDLDHLEGGVSGASVSIPRFEETDHPSDAPTMVAGLDEKSRRMMQEAESRARDKDLTELERELEASFRCRLGVGPRRDQDTRFWARIRTHGADAAGYARPRCDVASEVAPEFSDVHEPERPDVDPPRACAGLNVGQHRFGSGSARQCLGIGRYRRAARAEDRSIFHRGVRGQPAQPQSPIWMLAKRSTAPKPRATNKLKTITTTRTNKIKADDLALPELEPVTMSEVGTKWTWLEPTWTWAIRKAPRSILEEVVSEGSASQKQEAQRLIENLPG